VFADFVYIFSILLLSTGVIVGGRGEGMEGVAVLNKSLCVILFMLALENLSSFQILCICYRMMCFFF
jgi:hypothetical protein